MTKRDNQKMNMYAAVLQTCRAQQSNWESIPGFVTAVDELEQRLAVLHQIHTEHSTATVGVGMSKKAFIHTLTDHLYLIAKALSLKGLTSDDQGLYLRNKLTLSEWKKFSGNGLMHKADGLRADLEVHAAALAAYGITSEFIAETQVLINDMNEMLLKPRMAIISRKALTRNVKEQREHIDSLLKEQLDTLVLIFKTSLPGFFNQYQSARMIIGNGHKTPPQPDDGGSV